MTTKHPCIQCSKPCEINQSLIQCDVCNYWSHFKCTKLSNQQINDLTTSDQLCYYNKCPRDNLPFVARNDFEFIDESNIHQPLFKELNQTNYMFNKDGINNTNCKYRSMEWHSKNFVNASSNLSIIHFNTRSLNKNLNKIEEL